MRGGCFKTTRTRIWTLHSIHRSSESLFVTRSGQKTLSMPLAARTECTSVSLVQSSGFACRRNSLAGFCRVNALAFIGGACLVSTGAAVEKASRKAIPGDFHRVELSSLTVPNFLVTVVFDSMDFDSTEEISMDEMVSDNGLASCLVIELSVAFSNADDILAVCLPRSMCCGRCWLRAI